MFFLFRVKLKVLGNVLICTTLSVIAGKKINPNNDDSTEN